MPFYSVIKVEIVKLRHKTTTLLLLLLLLPPVLFGAGMAMDASFTVSDGGGGTVVVVEKALSGMDFAVNMLGQSQSVIMLVVIILASVSFSGEIEKGQIKSSVIRVCGRGKILTAKYIALLSVTCAAFIVFMIWSLLIYVLLVSRTEYANGLIFDSFLAVQLQYVLFTFLVSSAAMGFSFLLGIKLKTFPCFAVSYTAWFATQYTQFMDELKLLFPTNMPDYILNGAGTAFNGLPYAAGYLGYCLLFISAAVLIFGRADIKQ